MCKWMIVLAFALNLCSIPCGAKETTAEGGYHQGMRLFHAKKYQEALTCFSNREDPENQKLNSSIGQLLCHVALGNTAGVDPWLRLITQQLKEINPCQTPPDLSPMTQEKQMLSYQCRCHVRDVANQMRQTVEKLVRETVQGIFRKIQILRQLYPFIDTLELTGIQCCSSNAPWSCCLDPLLEQLEAWNKVGLESR